MIPDILQQSTSRFDQRFFLTALVPTAVFAPATAAVIAYSTGSLSALVSAYTEEAALTQVLVWLAVGALLWLLATILASQWGNVVRLYEGYPLIRFFAFANRLLRRIGVSDARPLGVAAHQRRYLRLERRDRATSSATPSSPGSAYEDDPETLLYDQYPQDLHRILPTALGNILRAAEDYGYHRYGFDSIYLWPRLAAVLPADYISEIEGSLIAYQTPLMVSFGAAILGTGSVALTWSSIATSMFLVIFVGSWTVSWLAYRLSFGAATEYGDLLRTAVDLYRTEMLERWWPELLAIEDDRRRLERLRAFVISGRKPNVIRHGPRPPISESGFLVIERERRTGESPTDSPESNEPLRAPRFGIRLTAWMIIVVGLVGLRGVQNLDVSTWVLVAKVDIAAFDKFENKIDRAKVRRGSLASDAVSSGDTEDDVQLDKVQRALALRNVARSDIIVAKDVGPSATKAASTDLVVAVVRPAEEVIALDLDPRDEVLLEGTQLAGAPACTPQPGTAPMPYVGPYISGEVLAVADPDSNERVSVLIKIDGEDPHRQCLGDLNETRILRRVIPDLTRPQAP